MVTHMKITIEISDHLLLRAKARAKKKGITLRALLEESLASSLNTPIPAPRIKPVVFKGKGLSPEFEAASWEKIRSTIYS
jgi:hypothetical protein